MKNLGITEQELNAAIEEEESTETLEGYPLFDEYTLGDRGWDEQLLTQEINMNPYSMSFFIKSLFCGNSGAIYMSTFINFFQELEISTLNEPNLYSSYSHAATLYILKMLEKNGVVKIIEYRAASTESWDYKELFKKSPKKAKLKMYDILFYKLRDLKREDKDLIKEIERTLRIAKRQVKIRFFDGELYTKLGILEILKCIFTGHFFIQLKKNLTYWKEAEGFKNDLSNVLYTLKKKNKRIVK